MAWEWNFTSPYEDFLGSQFAEARKKQAQELRNYFSQNQIAQNTAAIAQKYGFLPPDVQVGAAMIGLAAESPEFTPIINEYLNKGCFLIAPILLSINPSEYPFHF